MTIRPRKPLRLAQGENAEAWRSALADPSWLAASTVLKQDGASWVRRATILNRDVVIKCRPLNTLRRRIQSHLRLGHGDRHWRGVVLLATNTIPTALPFVLIHARVDGCRCELLVMQRLVGPSVLECVRDARNGSLGVRKQHALARALGEQLDSLIAAGLRNRDHKPSNLIVTRLDNDGADVAVIDCVGVCRPRFPGTPVQMFASLVIEPMGCGVPPVTPLLRE